MNRVCLLLFLLAASCASYPKQNGLSSGQEQPPRVSSGSLGKNIDELDKAVNSSLSRIDRIILNLGGNK
jgi:hypothetical protein